MKARYYLLGYLFLSGCDVPLEMESPVVVNFAQPFPATAPDLAGFLPRDRKRYAIPGDSGSALVIGERVLLKSRFDEGEFPGAFLDSMHIPRQSGSGRQGRYYQVQALAADSFRVGVVAYDTLLNLNDQPRYKLRHYQGWYYVSAPATEDSTKWEVQRLGVVDGSVVQQVFNPDSLRIGALDPATVQRRHYQGKLIITLAPQSRQAIRQVSSYGGLWLRIEDYLASVLVDSTPKASQ